MNVPAAARWKQKIAVDFTLFTVGWLCNASW